MRSDLKSLFASAAKPSPTRVAAELYAYFRERRLESNARDAETALLLEQEGYQGHSDINVAPGKTVRNIEQAVAIAAIAHAVDVMKGKKSDHPYILKSLNLFEHYRR